MSEPAPSSEDPAVAYAELTLRVLERMTEFGMRKLERLDKLDSGETDDIAKALKPADNFVSVSRAVRMTLVLGARTHSNLRDLKAVIEREQVDFVINRARAAGLDKPGKSENEAHRDRAEDLVYAALKARDRKARIRGSANSPRCLFEPPPDV